MTEVIRETATLAESSKPADGTGRIKVVLLTPGRGSSGYYSTETVKAAGHERVWPRGTQMHLDHDSAMEREDRPEGSVKNLAAVLTEDAYWSEADGGLVAEARVGATYRSLISDFADVLGTSIVASAEVGMDEIDGEQVRTIERLLPGPFNRVDFVTVAGRGGRIAEVMEAAQPVQEARSIGGWLEARVHQAFTNLADESYGDGRLSREERITLSGAIGEALTAFVARIEADASQLYQRDLWDEPEAATTAEEAALSAARRGLPYMAGKTVVITEDATVETIAEVATAALGTQISVTPTGAEKENTMPQIEEARLRTLEEAHGRVPALESERDQAIARAEEAEHKLVLHEARDYARTLAGNLVRKANSELSEAAVQRIVTESVKTITLTDDNRLDTEAFTTTVNAAREAEETYLAAIAEESGLGRVRGIGHNEPEPISESHVDTAVASLFGRTQKGA